VAQVGREAAAAGLPPDADSCLHGGLSEERAANGANTPEESEDWPPRTPNRAN
jgi:hypothetical protein